MTNMKNKNLYRYFLINKLLAQDMIFCAYALTGKLNFINTVDGCGITFPEQRGMGHRYIEFDIDAVIDQKNIFDCVGRCPDCLALIIGGHMVRSDGKIDFATSLVWYLHALNMSDNNQTVLLNNRADRDLIARYPKLDIRAFLMKSRAEFMK